MWGARKLSVVLLVAVLPPLHNSTADAAADDELKKILAVNAGGLSALKSYSYSYRLKTTLNRNGVVSESSATGSVSIKGLSRFSNFERDQEILDETLNKSTFEKRVGRVVVNDSYAAIWPGSKSSIVQLIEHPSIDSITPETTERLKAIGGERFESYAFGGERETLQHVLSASKDKLWRLEDGPGRLSTVQQLVGRSGKEPMVTEAWVIDVDRGFLITNFKAFRADGVVGFVRSIEPVRDAKTGLWFPSKITETTYKTWILPDDQIRSAAGKEVYRERVVEIDSVALNESVADKAFDLAALNVPDNTYVARTLLDGSKQTSIIKNSIALPQDINRELEANVQKTVRSIDKFDSSVRTVGPVSPSADKSIDGQWSPLYAIGAATFLVGTLGVAAMTYFNRRRFRDVKEVDTPK